MITKRLWPGHAAPVRIGIALLLAAAVPAGAGESSWSMRAREVADARLRSAPAAPADRAPAVSRPMRISRTAAPAPRSVEMPGIRLAADESTTRPAGEQPAPSAEPPEEQIQKTTARGPLPDFFDTVKRDLKEAPGLLWSDTKAVYTNPWNLVFLVGAGGVSVALRPEVDDDIEDHFDKHHTFGQDQRDVFDALGNPATGFIMAGSWYLAGQVMQNAKTYEVGKRMFSALIITDVSTVLLKVAANTEAPNDLNFAWPSGHMSSTMAVATVLHDAYGPWVGVPAYGAAVFSGIERLDSREHHFSDVIFGAALGWTVAHTVMKEHAPEIFGGEVVPYVDPVYQTTGVAWVKSLGN